MASTSGIPSLAGMQEPNGRLSTAFYTWLTRISRSVDTQKTNAATLATKSQTLLNEAIFIETPQAKDYRVWVNVAKARTITKITTRSGAGTCTLTGKINSTALGGTANSVSTTEESQAQSSANEMAIGDDFVITLSSLSSCTDLSIMVEYSESLD